MAILHLEEAKDLRVEGKRLGRAGMSQRVIALVEAFNTDEGYTYKKAMELAGALKAISIAAKVDTYWTEQVNRGYRRELYAIKKFEATPTGEDD